MSPSIKYFSLAAALLLAISSTGSSEEQIERWRTATLWDSPDAHQAAVADDQYFYAIASRQISKYDRATGQQLAVSRDPAEHLNSGFFWNGQLLCAHSNYPEKPEESRIVACDPQTMKLSTFHEFDKLDGSLTWIVRHNDHWWCNFAFYGKENAKSYIVMLDDNWNEVQRWNYPPALIEELGKHSLSGGIWHNGELLVTGHDNPVLYRLRLNEQSNHLELVGTQQIPFTGQGFAFDSKTKGLIGIDRKQHQVLLTRPLARGVRLTVMSYNIHHAEGTDKVLSTERIAKIIREHNPDLVALQEVDRKTTRVKGIDLARELAEQTGLSFAFSKSIDYRGGEYGNAILSRFPIETSKRDLLPNLNGGEQRTVLSVDVSISAIQDRVRFMATHLDQSSGKSADRFASTEFINAKLSEAAVVPTILAGDLNDVPDSSTLLDPRKYWTVTNVEPVPTFPATNPKKQIDFILVSPQSRWEILSTRAIEEPVASDHLPIVSTLELFND